MTISFSIFGIPVRVHVAFVLVAVAFGLSQEGVRRSLAFLAVWIVAFFLGVFTHELGHALVGRAFGWKPSIDLVALGGRTGFEAMPGATPLRRIAMVVAGPASGIVLGALVYLISQRIPMVPNGLADYALSAAFFLSFGWGLFNLIPILPLDGGVVLDELLRLLAPRSGRKLACYASLALTAGLAFLAVTTLGGVLQALALVMAMFFATECWRLLKADELGYDPRGGATASDHAYAALAQGDGARAAELAGRCVAEAGTQEEMDEAFYLLAWGRLLSGEPREAETALASISAARAPDHALAGAIALEAGDPDAALEHFEQTLPRVTAFVETRLVQAIVATRRFEEARRLFADDLGVALSPRAIADVQAAACRDGAWREAAAIGELLFVRSMDGGVAFNVACSHARLGEPAAAFDWLRRAKDAGFSKLDALDSDPDLQSIRSLPEWSEVRGSFAAVR